ncbi:MAG TPA: hypothetical protein PK156_41600 [Polyangium sp.]|nr:hypothetical protein [Polyangium sp.]
MSLRDLCLLYLVFGCFFAIAIYRSTPEANGHRLGSAALAVPLWPLWAPIALTAKRADKPRFSPDGLRPTGTLERVKNALADAITSIEGTPLAALLPPESASRIEAEVVRREKRLAELDVLLGKEAFDVGRLETRVRELETRGSSPRALSTARLDLDNVRRLSALRDRDARALEELCALVEALRTQVTLARFSGSSAADIGGIVGEVWARVEGLGAAIEAEESLRVEETDVG